MMVPFPPFEPDKSPFNVMATDNVVNCLPVQDGWRGMASFVTQSDALPSECLGAVYVRDSGGTNTIIAGTATNLYKLNIATTPYSWTEISKATDAYSVPTGDEWSFEKFGDYLIACNLGDTPQYYDIESPGNFADITGAPNARYVWGAGDFLFLGYLTSQPKTVQWSGLNDALFWTPGERDSDKQVLPIGGEIMGGIGDARGAVIITRFAMDYMQFAPASGYTFTRSQANTRRGTISPKSIVQIGQDQFLYLSEDGFFSGVEGKPIGAERVDTFFFNDVNLDSLYNVKGMADPFNKIVWWSYVNTANESRLIGYDWQLDRWCYSDQQISAAAALTTPDVSWDSLDDLYATIDDANVPLDSPLFKGGKPVFAGFTTDNKLAFAAGGNLAATLETAWVEPAPGFRSFLNEGRLIGDCATFTVESGGMDFHTDDAVYKDARSPSWRTGRLAFRHDARLHRQRLNVPADEAWTTVSGIDLKFQEGSQL